MSITITEYMDKRNKKLYKDIKEITDINENIKVLEQDPKIIEYLEKKEQKQKLENHLEAKKQEFQKEIQSSCNHELLFLTPKKEFWGYHDYEIECVLCEKHFKEIDFDLDSYYKSKKLIAYVKKEYDSYEGRSWTEYSPLYYSAEDIRNYYFELTQKLEKLEKEDLENFLPEDFNVEDAVWEFFCDNTLYYKQKKQKIKLMI